MSGVVEQALAQVPAWVTSAAVFGLPFLESSVFLGFVFPGETALLLGGVLASQGRASLSLLLVLAVLGAVAGDTVGYAVGRRYGDALKGSRPGRLVGERRWATAEAMLRRRGALAVFLGRFTALLRALVPTAAGIARVPYRTFALWNALGGITWAVTFVLVGYLAGQSYRTVSADLGRVFLAGSAVVVVGLLVSHRRRARRRRGDPPATSDHTGH